MSKNHNFFLAFLILVFSSCSNDPSKAGVSVISSKESSAVNLEKDFKGQTPDGGLKHLLEIKQQVEKGDYKQIEELIIQVKAMMLEDSLQMTAEQRLSFPQPNKEILADFLKSINLDSLKVNKVFEKKYSFHSAPKGYKPDSNECPDALTFTFVEKTNEFTLSINNRFLVDSDIGCAESMTIYYLTAEREKLKLKRLAYAG